MLFRREYGQLLKAQVILYDMTQKLAQAQADANTRFAELTLAQKHTDERLSALIAVVDSLVRRPPVQ